MHIAKLFRITIGRLANFGIAGAIALLAMHVSASAQEYPSRPITIVCPFGPGTAIDIIARQLAQDMSVSLGQSVVVDNRAGATGNIATDYVAKAPPNGYTVLIASTSNILNQITSNPSSDLLKDFEPIAFSGRLLYSLLVPASFPAQTLPDLVAIARAKPGKLNYAGYIGGVPQFLGEMLNRAANINMVMVPYKSTTDAQVDLLADRIQVWFTPVPSGLPVHASKQARMLAVTGDKRTAVLPDVATMQEQGYPDLTVEIGYFLMAPAKTPKPVVDKLYGAITKALHNPKVREALAAQGVEDKRVAQTKFATISRANFGAGAKLQNRVLPPANDLRLAA